MKYTPVAAEEFATLEGLDDWRVISNAIHADFRAGSFPAAASFASAVALAGEARDHHPDIDIRYPDRVRVVFTTHATGGLTTLDVELAREISAIASRSGHASERSAAQVLEIAIDTTDANRIRPFWAAILGYRDIDGLLLDPLRIGPPVWFQQMDAPRNERARFHIDISVAHDVADARISAALAAGGTLVTDRFARSWWVMADADGNEACISTWQDR